MERVGVGIADIGTGEFARCAARGSAFLAATKTVKDAGFCACRLSRPALTPPASDFLLPCCVLELLKFFYL
jgi:hypothetical protein